MKGYYEITARQFEPQWEASVFSCYSFQDVSFECSSMDLIKSPFIVVDSSININPAYFIKCK